MNWPELESFMTDGMASHGSEIILYTGQRGGDMISHQFAIANTVGYVEWMEEKRKIDSETASNLKAMLRSEDKDNFNIAVLAIQQLKK